MTVKRNIRFFALLLASVFLLSIAACETTGSQAAVTEVEPTADELERQRQEELERMRQLELERLRQEEDTQSAAEPAYDPDTVLDMINFDFDKYDIRDDFRVVLESNADWINAHPETQIQIEGHADERGTDEYNLALGERRAAAAKNFLVSLGVDEGRLYTISYGEEVPLVPESNAEAWAQNRRAQFKVTAR